MASDNSEILTMIEDCEKRDRKLSDGAIAVTPIGLRPMYERPKPGRLIVVMMHDGQQLECSTTMVYTVSGSGIFIYCNRKSIDESRASGWWYKIRDQKGSKVK